MMTTEAILNDLLRSVLRVLAGLTLAIVAYIFFTCLRFSLPRWLKQNLICKFIFEAPKFPPPIAWIPLVVLLAGIGEFSAILLVFIGAFAPLFTHLYDAIEKFPQSYLRLAGSLELSLFARLKLLYLKGLLPQFFTGLKAATGMGWMSVIAAEMVSGQSGLGYGIGLARIYLRYDLIFLYMFLMALMGQMSFLFIDWMRSRFVSWERERK